MVVKRSWVVTYNGDFYIGGSSLRGMKKVADMCATKAAHYGDYVKCRVLEANAKTGKTKVVYTGKYSKIMGKSLASRRAR